MKKTFCSLFSVLALAIALPMSISAQAALEDTRLLSQPAISKEHVAFYYSGDIWIADLDGENVRRLTSDDGIEANPTFSPDGRFIAFDAQYDGNRDVFIMPVEGGTPKRLTWHPGADIVRGFTPDGSAVLFTSPRSVFTKRYTQLFTVPLEGGFPEALKIPYAFKAAFSPDGARLAYTPLYECFHQWKHYRGGTVTSISICRLDDYSIEKIPQPEGRCNDTDPMWIGNRVYFRSDRNGEFDLYCFDTASGEVEQLTHSTEFPILDASGGDGKIVYEQAGQLHVIDPGSKQSRKLTIRVTDDLLDLRPRYVKGTRYLRNAAISPSGARAVLGFRGEIITVPAAKGDPRNLTNTTGAHERFPAWSPDGKSIACFSDESGEYELHIRQQDGKGEIRKFELGGSGFYAGPLWSHDSGKIIFTDNSRSLYWIDVKTGKVKKIAAEPMYTPGAFGAISGQWSPDSKWICYTLGSAASIRRLFVYSIEDDKSYAITDGMSDVRDPVFDKSGKYLYFFASTDAGPLRHWFAMSNTEMKMTSAIYMATLRKDVPSPPAKESDEETGISVEDEPEGKEAKAEKDKDEEAFSIEFDGLNHRILALPVEAGNLFSLQVGEEGHVYYLEAPSSARGPYAKATVLAVKQNFV